MTGQKIKKSQNCKKCKFVFGFFGKSTGHNGLKMCTVCHFIIVYKCYFVKISVTLKKNQSSPPKNNNDNIDCSMVWAVGRGFAQTKNIIRKTVCTV